MGQGRRQFTDEFKREAVGLLVSSGRPLLQIANELGIASSMLRNWRHRGPDPALEISRLRRENDRLRMEHDILKRVWPASRDSRERSGRAWLGPRRTSIRLKRLMRAASRQIAADAAHDPTT